jgi:hypothetical protein
MMTALKHLKLLSIGLNRPVHRSRGLSGWISLTGGAAGGEGSSRGLYQGRRELG